MINAQDIKNGTCIRLDNQPYFCIEFLHVKPGKGNTFMRTKLKNVVDGRVLDRRFNIGEKLEDVRVERRPYQFLYMDGAEAIFMNQETYDQIPLSKELISGVDFMKEGDVVEVVTDASTESVLYAEMPIKTVLEITYTEPGVKGDTATNSLKPATVETGATVRVPLFINVGEKIEVDRHVGSYAVAGGSRHCERRVEASPVICQDDVSFLERAERSLYDCFLVVQGLSKELLRLGMTVFYGQYAG